LAGYKFFHYGDNLTGPRPESEKEDIQTAAGDEVIYQNLRAGAESGWDFSSRWFDETNQLKSIRTFDILPVDLNSFLINPESDENYIATYNYLFWNDDLGIYTDYNYKTKMQTGKISLAMFLPLWQGFASEEQAAKVAKFAEKNLLKRGGLVTTNVESGEQWDSPNGWAPLQWIAVKGLEKYGFNQLANKIKKLWINTCKITYKNTHKMLEKYNVINPELMPEDGEYTVQDGFGWTNGVYLDFIHSV
jgi:alpha,alpha-trehalase